MATYETRVRIGDITLPAKSATVDGFAGDNNLRIFGNFLKHFINKYVGNLWRSVFLDESVPVLNVFPDDPYESVLNDDLPALYVYRQVYQGSNMELANELEIIPSQFTCVWIPSPEMLEERKLKAGFANAIAKAIYAAVQRGKDPGFQVEGFEHPEGTYIFQPKVMNVYSIKVSEGKWSKIDIPMGGRDQDTIEPNAQFPCLFVNINVEEMYEQSITDDDELSDDEFDLNTSIEFTIDHGDELIGADTSILPGNRI